MPRMVMSEAMNRRTFVKTAGIGGAATLVGVGLFGDRAAAASDTSFTATNPEISTSDGTISSVYIAPTGTVEWHNFDESVERLRISFDSKVDGGQFETVVDETLALPKGDDTRGQSGKFDYQDVTDRITLYSGAKANRFEQDADGEEKSTPVSVRVRITLLNNAGEKIDPAAKASLSATATFEVVVGNKGASATASGAANPGIEA